MTSTKAESIRVLRMDGWTDSASQFNERNMESSVPVAIDAEDSCSSSTQDRTGHDVTAVGYKGKDGMEYTGWLRT